MLNDYISLDHYGTVDIVHSFTNEQTTKIDVTTWKNNRKEQIRNVLMLYIFLYKNSCSLFGRGRKFSAFPNFRFDFLFISLRFRTITNTIYYYYYYYLLFLLRRNTNVAMKGNEHMNVLVFLFLFPFRRTLPKKLVECPDWDSNPRLLVSSQAW